MAQNTKIMACHCKHAGQDDLHGHGMRVFNFARKALTTGAWRCTVCLTLKQASVEATPVAVKVTK